jgi:uncharacterized protein YndB with AHSA1/START domain
MPTARPRLDGPPGRSTAVDAWYLDIEPDRRIDYAYDVRVGDTRLLASLATVELRPEGGGTRLVFTEQGAFFGGDDTTMFVKHMRNELESLAAELACPGLDRLSLGRVMPVPGRSLQSPTERSGKASERRHGR